MAQFFESKIKYTKDGDNGKPKKVTEVYIIDALSCSEAEARTIEHLSSTLPEDYAVVSVKETKITEIFNVESDFFYLVKCGFITIDEKTGNEKRQISEILVGASDFDDAVKNFKDGMKGTVSDYEIVGVTETPILEVIMKK